MKKQLNEIYRMQQLAGILKENNMNEDSQPDWSSMGPSYSDTIGGDNESEYNSIVDQVKELYLNETGQEISADQESDIMKIIDATYGFSFRMDNNVKLSDGTTTKISSYMKDNLDKGNYGKLAQDIFEILVDEPINEADTSMDIEREEYINKEINTTIKAIENLQELGLGSVDYILNMIKKEMKIKSTSTPASELPFS
jgi:hypothetical protein